MRNWLARDDDDGPIGFDQLAARQRDAQAVHRANCHVAVDALMDALDAKERARIALLEPPFPRDFDAVVAKTMTDRRAQAHADLDASYDAAVAHAELHLEVIRRRLGDEPVH